MDSPVGMSEWPHKPIELTDRAAELVLRGRGILFADLDRALRNVDMRGSDATCAYTPKTCRISTCRLRAGIYIACINCAEARGWKTSRSRRPRCTERTPRILA